jgi:hypothetical protein
VVEDDAVDDGAGTTGHGPVLGSEAKTPVALDSRPRRERRTKPKVDRKIERKIERKVQKKPAKGRAVPPKESPSPTSANRRLHRDGGRLSAKEQVADVLRLAESIEWRDHFTVAERIATPQQWTAAVARAQTTQRGRLKLFVIISKLVDGHLEATAAMRDVIVRGAHDPAVAKSQMTGDSESLVGATVNDIDEKAGGHTLRPDTVYTRFGHHSPCWYHPHFS